MGNCFTANNSDDISLLRGSESTNGQDMTIDQQSVAPVYSVNELIQPVFYPTPSGSRPATSLSEEEQVKIAKRIGLIQHLPVGTYYGSKRSRECVICMIEFVVDDPVRYLPCMHIYHVHCIDDWLMRSLTCPSCMEPVDAALLTSYETT